MASTTIPYNSRGGQLLDTVSVTVAPQTRETIYTATTDCRIAFPELPPATHININNNATNTVYYFSIATSGSVSVSNIDEQLCSKNFVLNNKTLYLTLKEGDYISMYTTHSSNSETALFYVYAL